MDIRRPQITRSLRALFAYLCGLAAIYLFFAPGLPRIGHPLFPGAWGIPIILLLLPAISGPFREILLRPGRPVLPYPFNWKIILTVTGIQILFHLHCLIHPLARLNSDNAVTLMMIRHLVHSGSRPIHFFGQMYQGSLNAIYYSIFHCLGFSLPFSVALGNLFLGVGLILLSIRLIRRLNQGGWLPVLLFLSLPLFALQRLLQESTRGLPLILIFLVYLVDLTVRAVKGEPVPVFRFGAVAGLLFWCYQPAAIVIAFLLVVILVQEILITRRIPWKFPLEMIPGFILGVFPHLLAEINNGFINAGVALSSVLSSTGSQLQLVKKAMQLVLSFPGLGPMGSMILQMLILASLIEILRRAICRREWFRILLFLIALFSLVVFSLSGHPPVARYAIHYHVFGYFFLLAVAQFLAGIPWRKIPVVPALIAVVVIGFMGFCFLGFSRTMAGRQHRIQVEVGKLVRIEPEIILGDYWDTGRFSPLVPEKILAPGLNLWSPGMVFAFSKYYPNALRLGRKWEKNDFGLIFPVARTAFLEKNLRDFGIDFTRVSRLSGAVLYSDFSPRPSLRFLNFITPLPAKSLHSSKILYREDRLIAFADQVKPPFLKERSIHLPGVKDFPGRAGFWSCVLESENSRIRLPMTESNHEGVFSLGPHIGLFPGTYKVQYHYMDMPVFSGESIRIEEDSSATVGKFRFSRLYDPLLFVLFQHRPRNVRFGAPCNGLSIQVRDRNIKAVDLEVISLLNFSSTIWTQSFRQAMLINGISHSLKFGKNRIRVPLPAEGIINLQSRHKSLIFARDSRAEPVYINSAVVLKSLTPIYASGPGHPVTPFLKTR